MNQAVNFKSIIFRLLFLLVKKHFNDHPNGKLEIKLSTFGTHFNLFMLKKKFFVFLDQKILTHPKSKPSISVHPRLPLYTRKGIH